MVKIIVSATQKLYERWTQKERCAEKDRKGKKTNIPVIQGMMVLVKTRGIMRNVYKLCTYYVQAITKKGLKR